jgi:hypothetical protein
VNSEKLRWQREEGFQELVPLRGIQNAGYSARIAKLHKVQSFVGQAFSAIGRVTPVVPSSASGSSRPNFGMSDFCKVYKSVLFEIDDPNS